METGFPLDKWTADRVGARGLLTREALEAWQLDRLNELLAYARAESPFYRGMSDWPATPLRSLAELERLPLTCAADLVRADPPLSAISQARANRVVTLPSSGTTGAPKRILFTTEDQEATIDFFHHGMRVVARPGDRVVIAFASDRPGGIADGLAQALRRLGAKPIVAPGQMTPEDLAAFIWAEQATVVVGPPVPLLAAARVTAHDGGPPVKVRRVLLSADMAAPSLVAALAVLWSCDVYQHWGMTEIGYGGAVDCGCHAGMHVRESDVLVEVVDPVSGRLVPDGMSGELVVTTLRQRAQPLLRYRTGDVGRIVSEPCTCGSVTKRIVALTGRLGACVALPLGGPLTLAALDDALFALEAVSDVAATVISADDPVELAVTVASPASLRGAGVLRAARVALSRDPVLGPALANGHLRVTIDLAPGTACSGDRKRRLAFAAAAPGLVA